MSNLELTMAGVDYDRFVAMWDGRVRVEGIDLNFLAMPVEEVFYRQAKYREFDVSEMSLSTYVLTLNDEKPPFAAIPVFPSRYFRHQSMFVNRRSGITEPSQLTGRRIGIPEYQITAGVWQRGILADEYGIGLGDIEYVSGGVDSPGRHEKVQYDMPANVRLSQIGPEETLSELLVSGSIDGIFSAHEPSCFGNDPDVVRLFPDYKSVEKDYFKRTRIFPIMHLMVVRAEILQAHPWVARSLMKACEQARSLAVDALAYRSSLKVMLPWLADHLEETLEAMGDDYWPYGIDRNRHVLDAFLRYSHEQGLANRRWAPQEIFAPSTRSSFVI
ncbi:ABC transporter substrate-binding protein [Microcella alkalica]|nr:ABC transporter substrate-binding protein [Microcella alkalica]